MRTLLAILLATLVLSGCAPSLRMHAVDNVGRRVLRVREVVEDVEKRIAITKVAEPDADATELEAQMPAPEPESPMTREELECVVAVLLYEFQEIMGWIGPLRQDVGPVPEKKQLELDTPKERNTRFEYDVKAGAKASRRARRKLFWAGVLSIPRKILEWTIKTIWKIIPWWVKLPVLAAFAMWAGGTILIYWAKIRAARAAVQAEATVSRLQRHVDAEAFTTAVDVDHNPDFARVHVQQKKIIAKRKRRE